MFDKEESAIESVKPWLVIGAFIFVGACLAVLSAKHHGFI